MPDHSAFLAHAKEAMRQMALHVGDFSQLCHALAGVLRQYTSVVLMPVVAPETEAILLFVLELCFSAILAISEFKVQVGLVTEVVVDALSKGNGQSLVKSHLHTSTPHPCLISP
jgi:hypothetical protein